MDFNNLDVGDDDDSDCKVPNPVGDTFSEALSQYFNSDVFSDFTIVCSDKVELPAHRNILSARTAVFNAMLKTDMMENTTKKLILNDIDSATMLEILRYIYTGKVQNLDKVAFQILVAADKYDLKKLKTLCVSELCNQLTKDNVFEFLVLADRHHIKKLEENCLDLVIL
jgi:speckle-type POZ protein